MASYKPPQNYRSAASRTPVPEAISVVSGVALLAEAPADPGDVSTPMVVLVGGQARTRVTTAPSAGQFMVRAATSPQGVALLPVLEFHASDEGLNGTCDYYRTGTVYTAEWFSFLLSFVTPLTGIASKAALDATYPATTDVTQHGRPGRMAFLADYSAWFSDGVAWRQLTGTAAAITAVDALYAASFGVTSDALASHVGAMTAALTAGASLDGVWAPPGVLAGDLLAAVTLAAALDAAWVPGGLAGALVAAVTLSDARDAAYSAGATGTAPTAVGVGTVGGSDAAGSTLGLPAGWAAGDALFLISSYGAAPAGWTQVAANVDSVVAVYAKDTLAAAGETVPSLNSARLAQMFAIRGAVAGSGGISGTPTSTDTMTGTAVTTGNANTLVVFLSFLNRLGNASLPPTVAGPTVSGIASARLGGIQIQTSGKGGYTLDWSIHTGSLAAAGSTGAHTATWGDTTGATYASLCFAAKGP